MPQTVALFPVDIILSLPCEYYTVLMEKNNSFNSFQCSALERTAYNAPRSISKGVRSVSPFKKTQPRRPNAARANDLHKSDKPTICLILCQQSNRILAEYALRGIDKPIGVSEFELTRALPDDLQSSLPTIEQIEKELEGKHD